MELQSLAHSLKVSDLEIEPMFLNGYDSAATVYEAFHKDQFFIEGARHFESAVLYTNPFNVLNEISQVISEIEQRATQCGAESILPFEVTFGFCLAMVLLSAVPNFEELAAFVADLAPKEGLCSYFEFASVTTNAARKYVTALQSRICR
jgi:hypothetical protein